MDNLELNSSRHKRMNAIRIRKESQIYSAEEKRILEKLNYEEKAKRENKIIADLRQLASEKSKQLQGKWGLIVYKHCIKVVVKIRE